MKKFLLISGIVVLAIILIGGFFIYANKDKLANMAIEKSFSAMESMVLQNLPQSISQDSVRTVFAKAVSRIKMGEANQPELQRVVSVFQTSLSDDKLDSLEVVNLLRGINQLGDSVAEK